MEFPADRVAPFALLLTELATNAAKHAYGLGGGVVFVTLALNGATRVLEVRDRGVGLPDDPDVAGAAPASLGMRLIRTLTQSLGGTLTATNQGGAAFRIEF